MRLIVKSKFAGGTCTISVLSIAATVASRDCCSDPPSLIPQHKLSGTFETCCHAPALGVDVGCDVVRDLARNVNHIHTPIENRAPSHNGWPSLRTGPNLSRWERWRDNQPTANSAHDGLLIAWEADIERIAGDVIVGRGRLSAFGERQVVVIVSPLIQHYTYLPNNDIVVLGKYDGRFVYSCDARSVHRSTI